MIIAFIFSAQQLHELGVQNIRRELFRKRIKAIKKYLLQADLERIREIQILATC